MRYLMLLFFLFSFVSISIAKPEYAELTGKDCKFCHINDSGGELTRQGKLFLKENLRPAGFKRIFRIIVYYFHFLFGILWFGTILYVHIILKPGYASKGLPKGELLLGWISIIVMFVTGLILTIMRISNVGDLYTTRFGIILSIKIILYFFMVTTAFIVTFVIGPKMRKKQKKSSDIKTDELTIEDLETFDGKNGNLSYIAYKGDIYDVTSSRLWKEGNHMGRHNAGYDLTEVLKGAPHSDDVLKRFPKVGKLVVISEKKQEWYVRLFFIFAYTNLVVVFIIIFLITLWKW